MENENLNLSPHLQALLERRPSSVGELIDRCVDAGPHEIGWLYPDAEDVWQKLTWGQFRQQVHELAAGFLALGLELEQRVAIMAKTRIEWILADLANNCAGGATTSIYPNTQPDEASYILHHSDSVIAIAETPELVARLLVHDEGRLQHIIILEGEADRSDSRQMTWAEFVRCGQAQLAQDPGCVRESIKKTGPNTLATLIYTSGTTGMPKGVEITHDNWVYEGYAALSLDVLKTDDLHYLWLPMSHVFGKCLVACDLAYRCQTAVDGRIDKIVSNLATIKPTVMCGAPRIFEKVRAAVITNAPRSGIKGRISRWAFSVGRRGYKYRIAQRRMPKLLAAQYKVADALVFAKLRALMGGRIRFFISGSAKLSAQVQEWFYSAGLILVEGYGMTESTAISFLNVPMDPLFGTVGKVLPGSLTKIAEDGEILIKGPGVMRGYHNDPERTREALDEEGWLHTGDIGVFDADGNLTITDRKKDLIKTSGGKYISPQEVEATIMANCPYISQTVVVGEGRKYASALVVLDRDQLLKWAKRRNVEGSYEELTQLPEIRRSIDRYIERANSRLERWETVKRYAIMNAEFSVDDGELTPNMKIRRNKVIEKYADVVDTLYDDDIAQG